MIFNQCIGKIVNRRRARIAGFFLTLAASLVLATPSFAQAQAEKADNVTTKKKQRPVSTSRASWSVGRTKGCGRACSIADVPELPGRSSAEPAYAPVGRHK